MTILLDINKAIDSSVELRNKKDLILEFIESVNMKSVVDKDWQKFIETKKIEELEKIIKDENCMSTLYRLDELQGVRRDHNLYD